MNTDKKSFGVRNVYERLQLIYKGKCAMGFFLDENRNTEVRITIEMK